MRNVPEQWFEPTTTTSPRPWAMSSTRRRMKARMMISPSSLSVCTSVSRFSRESSMTSPGSMTRMRTSARRPESMVTSPVN